MASKPPHILFILVDQMRADALGRATPTLNALARRGVRFDNCYCAATLCSPSRNSIITGLFPGQHGVCGNMGEPIGAELRGDTYARHLQELGYHTAYIGKHHYIDRSGLEYDLVQDDRLLQKYGYNHVWQVGDVADTRRGADRFTRHLADKGLLEEWRSKVDAAYVAGSDPADTTDGYIGESALRYVQSYAEDAPLFLAVGFVGPHGPYWAPEPYASMFAPEEVAEPVGIRGRVRSGSDLYGARDLAEEASLDDPATVDQFRRQRAASLGMVAFIDHQVDRLLQALAKRGWLEDTLVVFTSDHGNLLGDHGLQGKRFFYEPVSRVPLLMAGPGVAADRRVGVTVARELVSGVDLYPTFLDAAGAARPGGEHSREGISLLRMLRGQVAPRREVFSELGTAMMVRDAHNKLVYDPEQGGVLELYDLRRDPWELHNLTGSADHRHVEAEMVDRMLARMIRLTHYSHLKERINFQRVRV
jgi:arylsulfatase A-like enzyme